MTQSAYKQDYSNTHIMQLFISSELEASRPVGQLLALRGSGMEGQDDTTVCSGSYLPDPILTLYPVCDQSS